jgi:EmrB/QacA subfamily drug resistance transporter
VEHLDIRQKVTIMVAIMASMLFAALNQTIVGTALPRIVSELGGMHYFNWVFTIFMLASTTTAVLVGTLSDIYGRKVFILTGLGIFMVGTFLCGTAQDMVQLIAWRGVQGLGGGMIMATAFSAIGDLFSPRERGRWQGLMGAVFALASVLGPTLGGYIVDHFHWHWVFWIFLPVGFIAFYLILRLFPQTQQGEKKPIDYLGSILLILTIVPLLLAFTWAGNTYPWASWPIIGLFLFSVIAFLLFLRAEKKAQTPVMPLHLFNNRIFSLSNGVNFFIGVGMFGTVIYMPFFIQGVMGNSAAESGVIMMTMTLSMVLSSTIAGQLITKTGKYKWKALCGLFLMAGGMALLAGMNANTSSLTVVFYLIIVGLGLGIAFPIFNLTVQNAVSHRYLGVSTSAIQLFRQMGGTIGVAIMGSIMLSRMNGGVASASIDSPARESLTGIDSQVLLDPDRLATIRAQLPSAVQTDFDAFLTLLRESMTLGLSSVFWIGCGIMLLAFLLTLLIEEIPLRTSNHEKSLSHPDRKKCKQTREAGAHA